MKKAGIFIFFIFLNIVSFAQCAMCRASVESSQQAGETWANGFNSGILYLMAVPYVAFAVIAWLYYKNYYSKNKN
ncbi:MAG: hypothetical protein KatS3mg034_1417 [Vicingaceae bacterium]|nr:MAG: hypothetical protein KatS3mg034_1417 [Vicingaceae bacterium]